MPVYPGASVEQQRDHHRRVIRRPAAPVDPIGRVENVEVHLRHRVDDKPRQVPRRQPLADVGRHQKRLLAITSDKALAHREIVLNPPDGTRTYATATRESASGGLRLSVPRDITSLPRSRLRSASTPASRTALLLIVQTGHVMQAGGGSPHPWRAAASKLARLAQGDCSDSGHENRARRVAVWS